ncbi:MAG TPA: GNAT family N-acetyltransferase [Acidimicrobiales bacterium]|nr:GNAT family N-acetyltransferase [Acidimicrobiales bacterium]
MTEHLTTGWEPEAPTGDTALRAFLLAWADHLATVVAAGGGRVARSDDALFTDGATACPFDNTVVLLRPPVEIDVESTLAAADDFFPGERAWMLVSAWPLARRTGPGWHHIGHPPFMLRPAGGEAPAMPTGLRIVEVDDEQGVADYAAVVGAGFELDPGVLADPRTNVPAMRMFVGYEGERPVTTAAAWIGDGMAEVCWVATLPEARGRGYGEAVTWAATLAEPSLPAGLVASDLGRPVYERMEYLAISRFTLWMRLAR